VIRLGSAVVTIGDGYTVTQFADGSKIHALWAEQPGQAVTARRLGMSVWELNRSHDVTHSLLAAWFGLPHSPTLHAIANGRLYPENAAEERAVMAVQAFARAVGVDLMAVAERAGG
jgi:hypothetical protein